MTDEELEGILNGMDISEEITIGKITFSKCPGRMLITDKYKGLVFVRELETMQSLVPKYMKKNYPNMIIIWDKVSV